MNLKKTCLLIFLTLSSVICKDIIKGINWFGFETEYQNLMCSWTHNVDWHLDNIQNLGFNHIRLPFSLDFVFNNDWKNMDDFFEKCKERDIKIVLDFHRLHNNQQNFRPYDESSAGYNFQDFLNGWEIIANRYKKYDNLVALDLFNEYQGPDYNEWNEILKNILVFLEDKFPGRFDYYCGGTNWGGNLHNIMVDDLPFSDRITYTIHKYWFSESPPYEIKWDFSFGKHDRINIGEWGFQSNIQSEVDWTREFIEYLVKKDYRDTFFWTYSFNSGDTGGILLEDCSTVDYNKMELLYTLWDDKKKLSTSEYYSALRGAKHKKVEQVPNH